MYHKNIFELVSVLSKERRNYVESLICDLYNLEVLEEAEKARENAESE